MPENNPIPYNCLVCNNQFKLLAGLNKPTRRCPYCQSVIWPEADKDPLTKIGDFDEVQPFEMEARAVLFEARRGDARYLITLLDSGDSLYTAAKTHRGREQTSPYDGVPQDPHPNLLRTYPIEWVGEVAIAVVDFFDGAPLCDWLDEVGPISINDAVSIALACTRVTQHVGDQSGIQNISPYNIQILTGGGIKVSAFCGVVFHQFELPRSVANPQDTEAIRKSNLRLRRYSEHYFAPEFIPSKVTTYSSEERSRQNVFGLGCLLFELLADQSATTCGLVGQYSSGRSQLVWTLNERLVRVPIELKNIVQRMTARNPKNRYTDLQLLIEDLEQLKLSAQTVSFADRPVPRTKASVEFEPVERQAEQEVENDEWIPCDDDFDFRRIRWGMTFDEVLSAEPTKADRRQPIPSWSTRYRDIPLQLMYKFAEEDGQQICVLAILSPENLVPQTFDARSIGRSSRELFGNIRELEQEWDEECKLLRREGLHEEVAKKSAEFQEKIQAELQAAKSAQEELSRKIHSSIPGETLDLASLNRFYAKLKEMITADYGPPKSLDAELLEDYEFILLVAKHDGIKPAEVLRHCKTTVWCTDATYATLSIKPMLRGLRMIQATFASLKHRHLFPQ